jgi:hypothetical protein
MPNGPVQHPPWKARTSRWRWYREDNRSQIEISRRGWIAREGLIAKIHIVGKAFEISNQAGPLSSDSIFRRFGSVHAHDHGAGFP